MPSTANGITTSLLARLTCKSYFVPDSKLSLDAPAETYVPEMRGWKYPTEDSPPVRVRDLLNHTGGFVTDDPWGDRQTPLPEDE